MNSFRKFRNPTFDHLKPDGTVERFCDGCSTWIPLVQFRLVSTQKPITGDGINEPIKPNPIRKRAKYCVPCETAKVDEENYECDRY